MYPPRRYDKANKCLDSPRFPYIGDDDHRHVNGIALLEEHRYDPEGLRGKRIVCSLGVEFLICPEEIEHRVEVYESIGEHVGGIDCGVVGCTFEVIDVGCPDTCEYYIYDCEGECRWKPESETAAERG